MFVGRAFMFGFTPCVNQTIHLPAFSQHTNMCLLLSIG